MWQGYFEDYSRYTRNINLGAFNRYFLVLYKLQPLYSNLFLLSRAHQILSVFQNFLFLFFKIFQNKREPSGAVKKM